MFPLNPYIAGNPIRGTKGFYGRQDILRQVERVFASPNQNAVILFGQRRIGKTSVLLQLRRRLDPSLFVVIYSDMMDKAMRPMGEVLRDLARNIALEVGMNEPVLNFDDDGYNFQHEFLPQVYQALSSLTHHLVLLFDEFDVLDVLEQDESPKNIAARKMFPILRSWMLNESRLKFVFTLGRDPKDLESKEFLETFKGAQIVRISMLSREDTEQIITAPKEISYSANAVEKIYQLTHGHPYFTQLICELAFDRIFRSQSENIANESIMVDTAVLDEIIPQVFHAGDHVFAWIWDGLPPAERVFASALAQCLDNDTETADLKKVRNVFQTQQIRTIPVEIDDAPETLVKWEMLEKVKEQNRFQYRFRVPLIYRWVRQNEPFARIQNELDRINPRAERYYRLGKEELNENDFSAAINSFERALRINPDHIPASLAIAELYLEQGNIEKAIETYEASYKRDPIRSRAGFVKALYLRSQSYNVKTFLGSRNALADYRRILEIQPSQVDAKQKIADLENRSVETQLLEIVDEMILAAQQQNWDSVAKYKIAFDELDPESASRQTAAVAPLSERAQLFLNSQDAWEKGEWSNAIGLLERLSKMASDGSNFTNLLVQRRKERRVFVGRFIAITGLTPVVLGCLVYWFASVWQLNIWGIEFPAWEVALALVSGVFGIGLVDSIYGDLIKRANSNPFRILLAIIGSTFLVDIIIIFIGIIVGSFAGVIAIIFQFNSFVVVFNVAFILVVGFYSISGIFSLPFNVWRKVLSK